MKLLCVFILCLSASGAARADEAEQCRANAGTFLTGSVTRDPTFTRGHLHHGVELSHTHLTLLSDQDGRSYHIAIDNVFATGYNAAGESVPAPLSRIRTGDPLELCGKLFTRGELDDPFLPGRAGAWRETTPASAACYPAGWCRRSAMSGTGIAGTEAIDGSGSHNTLSVRTADT